MSCSALPAGPRSAAAPCEQPLVGRGRPAWRSWASRRRAGDGGQGERWGTDSAGPGLNAEPVSGVRHLRGLESMVDSQPLHLVVDRPPQCRRRLPPAPDFGGRLQQHQGSLTGESRLSATVRGEDGPSSRRSSGPARTGRRRWWPSGARDALEHRCEVPAVEFQPRPRIAASRISWQVGEWQEDIDAGTARSVARPAGLYMVDYCLALIEFRGDLGGVPGLVLSLLADLSMSEWLDGCGHYLKNHERILQSGSRSNVRSSSMGA